MVVVIIAFVTTIVIIILMKIAMTILTQSANEKHSFNTTFLAYSGVARICQWGGGGGGKGREWSDREGENVGGVPPPPATVGRFLTIGVFLSYFLHIE